jgi:hypothetical protein
MLMLGGRKKQRGGQNCSSCAMKGGKKRKMRGGQCSGPGCQNIIDGGQAGGATTALNPASLSGDSFDRSGAQLAKTAHNLYVKQNYDLAAIKNVNAMSGNAMKGGQTKMRGGRHLKRTAKKYSRSKSSKSARRGGGGLVEAVVPLGLLAAQQTLFKRGSSKNKRHNKYGGSRRRSRSRRN